MLKVQTMGRLAKDATIYESSTTGTKFLSFTLAVNTKSFNDEKTYWIDVRSFNPNHLKLQKYLTKGKMLMIGGDFNTGTMTDKSGTVRITHSLIADYINFANIGGSAKTTSNDETSTNNVDTHTSKSNNTISNDDNIDMGSTFQTPVTVSVPSSISNNESNDELPF